jgi:hypothetical protein
MDDDRLFQIDLLKRLDIIIKLLLEPPVDTSKELTAREQIARLHSFGLRPSEISRIMGIPISGVGAQLSQIKQKRKGKMK